MHPLIGITGLRHEFVSQAPAPNLLGVASADDYALAVEACGGIPVVIPYLTSKSVVSSLADKLDGVILGGGEDPDPILYGAQPKSGLGTVVRERDDLELQLVSEMLAAEKPLFGICRGIQVLNVAFGGTLWQDLPKEWRGSIQHRQKAARRHLSHSVKVDKNSCLFKVIGGKESVFCNSYHHQAVRRVGPKLRAVAWDEEGLVEAVEQPNLPFVLGVQWHPENLWQVSAEAKALFASFVLAASPNLRT